MEISRSISSQTTQLILRMQLGLDHACAFVMLSAIAVQSDCTVARVRKPGTVGEATFRFCNRGLFFDHASAGR